MLLVEFYKGAPDVVKFQETWNQEQTYLDKLKIIILSDHTWGCLDDKHWTFFLRRALWLPGHQRTKVLDTSWNKSTASSNTAADAKL
ncbi:hypothetical protein JD844_034199 [Phrynosoma platyrhinos]|uniref:Uncharacterized protein n=1 Tax=Phrynosoma platyrhinos TaxID=52577 RepID=A0ABQ7T881_PHRPL|nr:hypothetical protein JD844_034199 [Phrynosoma platyrhinos]